MKNALAWTATCMAAVALVLGALALRRPTPTPAVAVGHDLAPLAARIGSLEEETARLRPLADEARLTAPPPTGAREVTSQPPDPRVEELIARLAELEKAVDELRSEARTPVRVVNAGVESPDRRTASIEDLTARAHDAAATEEQRLAALRNLRGRRLADGGDARLAVLDDMIRLAQASTNGEARADVWRQLSHVTDARLKRPLLDALAFDTHARAREEAAETLADFLPDAQVEAALRAAAQNDADPRVRRQAAESLAGGR